MSDVNADHPVCMDTYRLCEMSVPILTACRNLARCGFRRQPTQISRSEGFL